MKTRRQIKAGIKALEKLYQSRYEEQKRRAREMVDIKFHLKSLQTALKQMETRT